ncbi:hypothetical protein GCM10010873_05500 [Cypionkella aquatica]|uniref:Uncharacterized protein n=1 Tax=Cypionkella aquatica TaxID=1756042 RepID=A0AA37WYW2_9RHOB|nr:hypothetical protein [Cypionkella aquatica]GLS85577.1 hypothetical protein GCM10010873_05500 [Cypionkella aquatica]
MPVFISQASASEVLGLNPTTVGQSMSCSPHFTKNRHPHYYLVEVLKWTDRKARPKLAELVKVSDHNSDLYVGKDGLMVARSFEAFLHVDPKAQARSKKMQAKFMNTLATIPGGDAFYIYGEALRSKVLLASGITEFVLTGEESNLPHNWPKFIEGFCLINGGLDPRELEEFWTEAAAA